MVVELQKLKQILDILWILIRSKRLPSAVNQYSDVLSRRLLRQYFKIVPQFRSSIEDELHSARRLHIQTNRGASVRQLLPHSGRTTVTLVKGPDSGPVLTARLGHSGSAETQPDGATCSPDSSRLASPFLASSGSHPSNSMVVAASDRSESVKVNGSNQPKDSAAPLGHELRQILLGKLVSAQILESKFNTLAELASANLVPNFRGQQEPTPPRTPNRNDELPFYGIATNSTASD